VDQQATRSPGIQSGATIDSSRLKGSQGVTPFLKVTDSYRLGLIRERLTLTQGSTIAMNILVMNLEKLLELFCAFHMLASSSLGQRIGQ
jgi:hypothetical protein